MSIKKLDDETVFEIKKLLKEESLSQKDIAKMFNVTESAISKIKRKKRHKQIICLSEEYSKGFEDGYKKGVKDTKRWQELAGGVVQLRIKEDN